MSKDSSIDVFLRGNRDYVQGTQLIARISDLIDGNDWVLLQASFTKISNKQINALRHDTLDSEQENPIGKVSFEGPAGVVSFLLTEAGDPADQRELDMGIVCSKLQGLGQLSGVYSYAGADDLEAILNAVVQCVKALHEEISPDVSDVWLTGIRRFPLSLGWNRKLSRGTLYINNQRIMHSNGVYQSLLNVEVKPDNGHTPISGFVTFAFKSAENFIVN